MFTLAVLVLLGGQVEAHQATAPDGSVAEVRLYAPQAPVALVRIPGPMWPGPHGDCLMCLGNHLLGGHGMSYAYLQWIGYHQWQTLHDNLHNNYFTGHVGYDASVIGYGDSGGYSGGTRRGFFGRR